MNVRSLALLRVAPLCLTTLIATPLLADGFVRPPQEYRGSLEEKSQEAIIIFNSSETTEATEDLILKISVDGNVDSFAWVVPFPKRPEVHEADADLFKELYDYVKFRTLSEKQKDKSFKGGLGGGGEPLNVSVLSREIVGSYDVAVVRENVRGSLNDWLKREGFQRIEEGEDVIEFYRQKDYVFACIKVTDVSVKEGETPNLHPLRFTFTTGGRDGIYFPMKLTGLQQKPFDVNLYVFYQVWLNDHRNEYGYEHRDFYLKYRDWDTPLCKPNAGKNWSNPADDPFLKGAIEHIPTVSKLFAELHPDENYYLTNIHARNLDPKEVRAWPDDLWLFPNYVNHRFRPHDARKGGVAAAAYED